MVSVDWTLKLIAFLHDPPDKVLGLEGHQRRAFQRIEQLIGEADFLKLFGTTGRDLTRNQFEEKDVGRIIKEADRVAAGMDRAPFPRDVNLSTRDFLNSPQVRHPLSGREHQLIWLVQKERRDSATSALDRCVNTIKSANSTPQQRFLWLWWKFPETLAQQDATTGLGTEWYLVPADTRIVDHTIWDHLSITAALAVALPQAALLVCSLGPVQDFIRTARRTQDLWMGSYILSYLSWHGIQVIAQEFGPDCVLYPSLRGQPLVDLWLSSKYQLQLAPSSESLTRATLPNKFVALLPAAEAKAVATRVANAMKDAWEGLADSVSSWLKNTAQISTDEFWEQMFDSHKRQMPEIYWCIHRWPDTSSQNFTTPKAVADAALKEVRRLLRPPSAWEFQHIYDVFSATAPEVVNIGTLYGRLHDLAQRGFEARKHLRDFAPVKEEGEKCTLCGVRAALHNKGQVSREEVHKHWEDIARQVRERVKGEFVTFKPGGRERLCGVCLVKRLAQRGFFEGNLRLSGGFPSTSSVAAASFKAGVLEKLGDPGLKTALEAHLRALEELEKLAFYKLKFAKETGERILPRLKALRDKVPTELHELATDFLCYDGEFFYEETFTVERLRDDYDLTTVTQQQAVSARQTLRALLDACHRLGIAPPAKYFAILMLNGDEMGKWLSGENAPLFSQALHPDVVKDLRDRKPEWNKVLDSKRVVSPALHATISSALANFVLYLVPLVVEQRYCGRVVYAGGDELLALLPVDQALSAARELRALFSGEASIDSSGDPQVCFRDPKVSGFLVFDSKPLMTMGPSATASVGISIAHHLSPLERALAAARRVQESAKKQYGRNSLCLHFLKRSGEELRMGVQWFYEDTPNKTSDPVALLTDIQRRFAEKRISLKFAHAVFDEARGLVDLPDEAQKSELRRLLQQHKGDALNTQQGEEQARELASQMAQLARCLNRHCPKDALSPDQPQPGMVELAKWMLLLRFLAQGGGE